MFIRASIHSRERRSQKETLVAMNSAITSCEPPSPVRDDGVLSSHTDGQRRKKGQSRSPSTSHLAYGVLDIPPWYLCIFLGIQGFGDGVGGLEELIGHVKDTDWSIVLLNGVIGLSKIHFTWHFLTALGGLVAVPLILAKDLCLQHDPLTQSYLISTIFFVSGICTLLQVFLGVSSANLFEARRSNQGSMISFICVFSEALQIHAGLFASDFLIPQLSGVESNRRKLWVTGGFWHFPTGPTTRAFLTVSFLIHRERSIVPPTPNGARETDMKALRSSGASAAKGGTFAFVAPSLAMLSLPAWKCPEWTFNASRVNTSSPEFIEEWQMRIREMLVGFSGLIGFLMRFIGPLTIAPTISLVALPLFDSAGSDAGIHWGISAMTIFLIVLFSQYLKNVAVPVPVYGGERKCQTSKFYLFQVFPALQSRDSDSIVQRKNCSLEFAPRSANSAERVLLALCISWLICFILTVTNALPSAPTAYGYLARTDTKGSVLNQAPWFRFPYPGQWGLPTISLAGVFGIIAGVISSMVESVGDYYACARLVGAPPPPKHAINRGIGIEGLGCLLAGAWGTGNGTTSYSENVGALGITRVGSRVVIVAAGCVLLLMGMFGKIGAAFATIPTPVIGGMFLVMFGVITAVGISNLQYVDMNSSRNLFVFGFSIYCGLAIPNWVNKNPEMLQTGILQLDQVIQVLLTTGMFVGGFLGFLLDNTIPGSQEERGLLAWNQIQESEETRKASEVYGLPWGIGTKFCTSSCVRRLPFWPRLEHGGKGQMSVSQLTLCSQVSSGEQPRGNLETRM
ncbi:Solute carrier family 23 member 2 [Tupaia chinensis]|uniref:Solute carrier family 23 member 2 n=1 Tax=Tupaia chinensis TaxID=246437 RepID=L9L0Q6_TUPCH|nr:Solute carrier family 23 member 2 [Tupaia chinensis]